MGCDAVAVTSDDATRYSYLRQQAWSLERSGVELLADPGLVEVAGLRMRIRPLMDFPLLHVEKPHVTGWRRLLKRATNLVLTSVGLMISIPPLTLGTAALIKLQDGGAGDLSAGPDRTQRQALHSPQVPLHGGRPEERKPELMAYNEGRGALFQLSRDPRVTRVGHFRCTFSLDKGPQLSMYWPAQCHWLDLVRTLLRSSPKSLARRAGGRWSPRPHRTLAGQRTLQSGRR